MAFGDWLYKIFTHHSEGFGYAVFIIVFFLIPILLYLLITWDPAIGWGEDGDPTTLGLLVVVGLYWLGAYIAYQRYATRTRLNRLLDKLLDDEEADHLFEIARRRRQILKEEKYPREKGEERGKWFGI